MQSVSVGKGAHSGARCGLQHTLNLIWTSRAEKCSAHFQPMSELAQRRELREAEELEGVVLQRFAFQRVEDETTGPLQA